MNRRQLLARLLGGSVALAAADIWLPGEKSIFLPPRGGWVSIPFQQPSAGMMALLEHFQKEWNAMVDNSIHEAFTTGQSFLKGHCHDGQVFWRSVKGDEFFQASGLKRLA